jgi:hypothetical protein
MLASIDSAIAVVRMESYIFASDEIGWKFAQALARRAAAGVDVRVHLGAAGAWGSTSSSLQWYLRNQGVQLRWFHRWSWRDPLRYNRRGHRKLLVVDDRVAYVGGIQYSPRKLAPVLRRVALARHARGIFWGPGSRCRATVRRFLAWAPPLDARSARGARAPACLEQHASVPASHSLPLRGGVCIGQRARLSDDALLITSFPTCPPCARSSRTGGLSRHGRICRSKPLDGFCVAGFRGPPRSMLQCCLEPSRQEVAATAAHNRRRVGCR